MNTTQTHLHFLGKRDEIRCFVDLVELPVLVCPKLTRGARACLHFVRNHEHVVVARDFAQAFNSFGNIELIFSGFLVGNLKV